MRLYQTLRLLHFHLLPRLDLCYREMALHAVANERDQEKFSSRLGSVWSEGNRRQVRHRSGSWS